MKTFKQFLLGVVIWLVGLCTVFAQCNFVAFICTRCSGQWREHAYAAACLYCLCVFVLAPVPGLWLLGRAFYRFALWEGGEIAPPRRPVVKLERDSDPPINGGGYRTSDDARSPAPSRAR